MGEGGGEAEAYPTRGRRPRHTRQPPLGRMRQPSASCYRPVLMSHPKTKCALQGTVLPQGSRPKSEQLLHPCEQVQQLQQLQQLRAVSASPESTWPETGEDMTQRSYPESAPPPAVTLAGQSVTLAGHWPESTPPPPPALELVEAGTVQPHVNARFINGTASRY